MNNHSRGLPTTAKADVSTGLVVVLVELKQQNMFYTNGQSLGPVTRVVHGLRFINKDKLQYLMAA